MNSQQPSKDEAGSLRRPSSAAGSERRRFWERPSAVCEDTPEVNRKGRVRHMTIIISKTKLALGVLATVLIGATVVAAGDGPFTDNPDGTYYHDPVEWAFDNGVTTGTSDTTFSPMDPVTRGQNVTFAYRYDQNIVQPELETIDENFGVVTSAINDNADLISGNVDLISGNVDLISGNADAINDNADAISEIEDNVATVASDVNNAARAYFANVDSDGTILKGNGITVERTNTGTYTATLPESATNCAVQTALHTNTDNAGEAFFQALAYALNARVFSYHNGDAEAEEVTVLTFLGDPIELTDVAFSITAYCSDPTLSLILPGIIIGPIFPIP